MILVGATIVASIETIWAGTVTPPTAPDVHRWHYSDSGSTAIQLEKGAEMGRFKLGSTVILLFGKDAVEFTKSLANEQTTRMGEVMAEGKANQ